MSPVQVNKQQYHNSALQEAYDQLAISERRFRELYDGAPDMYHTLDLEGNFVDPMTIEPAGASSISSLVFPIRK